MPRLRSLAPRRRRAAAAARCSVQRERAAAAAPMREMLDASQLCARRMGGSRCVHVIDRADRPRDAVRRCCGARRRSHRADVMTSRHNTDAVEEGCATRTSDSPHL